MRKLGWVAYAFLGCAVWLRASDSDNFPNGGETPCAARMLTFAAAPMVFTPDQRDLIVGGDTQLATSMLIEMMPDGDSLFRVYEAVFSCVQHSQGKMYIEAMVNACPPFHRWHAEQTLQSPDRQVAVISWIAQKFWETQDSDDKEALYSRFVADVQNLVETGEVDSGEGLKALCDAIFAFDAVEPSYVPQCLVDFVFQLPQPDAEKNPERIEALIRELREVSTCKDQKDQLTSVLKAFFPDVPKSWEPDAWYARLQRGTPFIRPIRRSEYMRIPNSPLEHLLEKLRAENAGSSYLKDVNIFGSFAVAEIALRFESNPDAVSDAICSLIDEEVKLNSITNRLFASETPEQLQLVILDSLLQKMSDQVDYVILSGISLAMGRYLEHTDNLTGCDELQKRAADVLLAAAIPWERAIAKTSYSTEDDVGPIGILSDKIETCNPNTRRHVQDEVSSLLQTKDGFRVLPPERQRVLEQRLRSLQEVLSR